MPRLLVLFILAQILSLPAYAGLDWNTSENGWVDLSGNLLSNTDWRKTKNGFSAWIMAISDKDWEAKWNTPPEARVRFNEVHILKKGEQITILTFLSNAGLDKRGNANVLCDLTIVRANRSIAADQKDIPCQVGEIPGNPTNIRIAAPVINFKGEQNDPVGKWVISMKLRDHNRDVNFELVKTIELIE